jgi:hypothetical protein
MTCPLDTDRATRDSMDYTTPLRYENQGQVTVR